MCLQSEGHDHVSEMGLIAASRMTQDMLAGVARDPSKPVKRVYNETVANDQDLLDDVPEFSAVRSRLTRKRLFLVPPIPGLVENVTLEGEWTQTWNGTPFLAVQDND